VKVEKQKLKMLLLIRLELLQLVISFVAISLLGHRHRLHQFPRILLCKHSLSLTEFFLALNHIWCTLLMKFRTTCTYDHNLDRHLPWNRSIILFYIFKLLPPLIFLLENSLCCLYLNTHFNTNIIHLKFFYFNLV
jgi:hypothetical protein